MDTNSEYKKEILDFAANEYGTLPEYLWKRYPNYAVLRNPSNRKWYALIADVPRETLGLEGKERIDIINVKCEPSMVWLLLDKGGGYLPAYHMNRKNWITILLDGSIELERILYLMKESFHLTSSKPKQKTK